MVVSLECSVVQWGLTNPDKVIKLILLVIIPTIKVVFKNMPLYTSISPTNMEACHCSPSTENALL